MTYKYAHIRGLLSAYPKGEKGEFQATAVGPHCKNVWFILTLPSLSQLQVNFTTKHFYSAACGDKSIHLVHLESCIDRCE